jgi:hypothetical protein
LKDAFNAIDWGKVGQTVGDLLVKALSGIASFISKVDWNNVGQQLVHGIGVALKALGSFLAGVDWGTVLVALTRGIIAVLRGLAGLLLGIATALGKAIVTGIGMGLSNLGAWFKEKLQALPSALIGLIGTVANLAITLGKAIVSGMISGMESLVGSLVDKARSVATAPINAAKGILGIGSPSKVFEGIGADTIRGFILGITTQQPALEGKTREAVQKALDAARAVVQGYQEKFATAFGALGEHAKRAFEAKTQNILDNVAKRFDAQIAKWQKFADALTPAEQALKDLDKAEQTRSQNAAVAAAAEQMAKAQAMADGAEKDAAILAAMEAQRQAELSITRTKLEELAAVERAARDQMVAETIARQEELKAKELQNLEERRAQMAAKLDEQLATLQERLAKHPGEYDKINAKIKKLLADFGIPMKAAGENLGKAFAAGLRSQVDEVEDAARALARAVERQLKGKSPTEAGPMSTLDTWWTGVGKTLVGGLDYRPVERAAARMAGLLALPAMNGAALAGAGGRGMVAGPRMAMAGGYAGGGSVVNHFHFPNYVGNQRELTEAVRKEWQRQAGRNG